MVFFIKRENITAGGDITIIGKRGYCGKNAEPYDSKKSAETALKRQEKLDQEYCPDCTIFYKVVEGGVLFETGRT